MPRPSYANVERGRTRVALDIIWRASVLLGIPLQKLVPEPLVGEPESAGLAQPGDVSSTSAELYWHSPPSASHVTRAVGASDR
jgi:hypothetical protein